MRLRKLILGSCEINVESDNGIKPHVKKHGDSLLITPKCKCGESMGEFSIADKSSLIIERATNELKEADAKGKARRFSADESSLIPCACSVCGRQWHVTARFTLVKQWIQKFQKRYEYGHRELTYGNALVIDIEINHGYFDADTRQPITLQDLRHACGTLLMPRELFDAHRTIIAAIDAFFHETDGEVKPIKLSIKDKCTFCLGKYHLKVTLTPTLPTSQTPVYQTVKAYRAWLDRAL